jgi:hypothetical protein
MIILIHVIVAIASIIMASLALLHPTMKKLIASYGLIIATVASGTFLLVSFPGSILRTCLMGVSYLVVVTVATAATHVRLRKAAEETL